MNTPDSSTHFIVAAAAIIIKDGQVLALRRAPHKVGAGLWEVVSGRLELGEEPFACAEREIAEETGLSARVEPRPLCTYTARRGAAPMVVLVFRAAWQGGEVQRSSEHDAHRWLDADGFAQTSTLTPLVAAVRQALES